MRSLPWLRARVEPASSSCHRAQGRDARASYRARIRPAARRIDSPLWRALPPVREPGTQPVERPNGLNLSQVRASQAPSAVGRVGEARSSAAQCVAPEPREFDRRPAFVTQPGPPFLQPDRPDNRHQSEWRGLQWPIARRVRPCRMPALSSNRAAQWYGQCLIRRSGCARIAQGPRARRCERLGMRSRAACRSERRHRAGRR